MCAGGRRSSRGGRGGSEGASGGMEAEAAFVMVVAPVIEKLVSAAPLMLYQLKESRPSGHLG